MTAEERHFYDWVKETQGLKVAGKIIGTKCWEIAIQYAVIKMKEQHESTKQNATNVFNRFIESVNDLGESVPTELIVNAYKELETLPYPLTGGLNKKK